MKYNLYWKRYDWSDEITPVLFPDRGIDKHKQVSSGYVFDREMELSPSAHVDQAAIIGAAVAELREEQAKHTAAITELDRKIQELQCIEFKPDA